MREKNTPVGLDLTSRRDSLLQSNDLTTRPHRLYLSSGADSMSPYSPVVSLQLYSMGQHGSVQGFISIEGQLESHQGTPACTCVGIYAYIEPIGVKVHQQCHRPRPTAQYEIESCAAPCLLHITSVLAG